MAVQPFLKTFQIEKPNMNRHLKVAITALREGITYVIARVFGCIGLIDHCRTIQEDAMDASASAYITAAMDPIYDEVKTIKGHKGAPRRRMAAFEKKVCTMGGVWMKIYDGIESGFNQAVATYIRNVERGMRDIFDTIHKQFNMVCEE